MTVWLARDTRRCISCQLHVPLTQFVKRAVGSPYYRSQCNACRLEAQRVRDKRRVR